MWPSISTSDFPTENYSAVPMGIGKKGCLGSWDRKAQAGTSSSSSQLFFLVWDSSHPPSGLVVEGSPLAVHSTVAELSSLRRLFRTVALIGESRSQEWGGLSCSSICRVPAIVRGVFSKETLRWKRHWLVKMTTGQVGDRVPGSPTLSGNSLATPPPPASF